MPESRTHAAGHELRNDDSAYRKLIDYTSDLIVQVDLDGRFLFVSPSYCELFGKTEHELLGNRFMPLVHEEDREATEQAMQSLYRPPFKAQLEQRAMTKLGWRWLAWTDNAIFDDTGKIAGVVGVGRDITERKRMEDALRTSQRQLHETMRFASLGQWELKNDGRRATWSEEIYQTFGIDASEEAGLKTLEPLVHPDDWKRVRGSLQRCLTIGDEHHVDYRILRPDGEERWVECRAIPIRRFDGSVDRLSGFLQDITIRKRVEAALRRSEQRFRAVATATNDLVYEWVAGSGELIWHGDIDKALGYPPSGFPHTLQAWIDAIHPEDRIEVGREVDRMQQQGGTVDMSYRIAAADGSWRIWRDKGMTIQTEATGVHSMIGGCTDITEQHRAEARVQHLAFHDSLTDLPNRHFFREELKQVLENFRRDGVLFALHYLDLDYFKDVNDSLGHQVGDQLLCQVVHRVKSTIRAADIFARLGGDEFGVIQTKIADASQVSVFALKIVQAIGREFQLDAKKVRISTSIGIVMPDEAPVDADDLLKKADTALYKAKDAGRGAYAFFHDSMTIKLQQEMELVSALSSAASSDQLCLEYQPQFNLRTRELIGLEALLRWNHPKRGRLLPGDFLGVAEKRGLIGEISDWALAEACRQATRWCAEGRRFGRMAVNLSAMQVESDDFFERIDRQIRSSGLDPALLTLEFTETVLMKATDQVSESIRRLSETGVQFAIDDFGTGFSSLSYLKHFKTDKIKIDRAFTHDLETDPSDAEIVKATIALGRALGLKTLAEGVETEAQARFLAENDCEEAQGFLFGRPMPPNEVEKILGKAN